MRVLAPRSAHARPSARRPIDTSGNSSAHVCNTPLIMGDRHQNFEDPSTGAQDIRKTKFDLLGFF